MSVEDGEDQQNDKKKEQEIIEQLEDEGIFTDQVGADDKIPGLEHRSHIEYPHFLDRIVNRLNQGFSPIIVISGQERIGKSELAQLILHLLHNKSNVLRGEISQNTIQDHLCYTVEEFLDIVIEKVRTGIIVDEAGAILKATKHQSDYNEIADEAIQTMGYKNNLYIFITPVFTRLDKKIRMKADVHLEVIGRGQVKCTGIRTNYGKIRTKEKNLRKLPLPPFIADRPPEHIRLGYDKKEKEFKSSNLEEKRQEFNKDEEIDADDLF